MGCGSSAAEGPVTAKQLAKAGMTMEDWVAIVSRLKIFDICLQALVRHRDQGEGDRGGAGGEEDAPLVQLQLQRRRHI